jgi:hypothetical protein
MIVMKNRDFHFLILVAMLGSAMPAAAGIHIRFDAPTYAVTAGGEFTVGIAIDGDDRTSGDQPVPNGLFSFGIRINCPSTNAVTKTQWLNVVSPLDNAGLVPGAVVQQGDGYITAKGNIVLTSSISPPYGGTALLTLNCVNRFPSAGRYSISLASAATSPSQTLFVDGLGNALDASITYGVADVIVRSDPLNNPPRLDIQKHPSGGVELSYKVASGQDYFIQSSGDLKVWSDLYASPKNEGNFLAQPTSRFLYYRLRVAPQ